MPIVILLALILRFAPMHTVFEYNVDEGIELTRADLLDHGFTLYSRTYDDQPPLLTALIPCWWRLAGKTVDASRLLVYLFSCGLIWAFYNSVRILSGRIAAFTASFLLLFSLLFLRLSVSVMAGIPSLALAMASLYCLILYRKKPGAALIPLSAAFLALSMHIKFFTAFLVVPCAIWAAWLEKKDARRSLSAALTWLATGLAVYGFIVVLFFHPRYELFVDQLFKPHLQKFASHDGKLPLMALMAIQDCDIVLLAALGLCLGLFKKRAAVFFPLTWLALAILILSRHRPVWNHYYVLLSIPLCWLAGSAVGRLWEALARPESAVRRVLAAAVLLAFLLPALLMFPYKCARTWKHLGDLEATAAEKKVIETVASRQPRVRWMLTDRPIFAFHAGVLTPPQAPIYTTKALGFFNASLFDKYAPEFVLWGRFKDIPGDVARRVERDYSPLVEADLPPAALAAAYRFPPRAVWSQYMHFFLVDLAGRSDTHFVRLFIRNDLR